MHFSELSVGDKLEESTTPFWSLLQKEEEEEEERKKNLKMLEARCCRKEWWRLSFKRAFDNYASNIEEKFLVLYKHGLLST